MQRSLFCSQNLRLVTPILVMRMVFLPQIGTESMPWFLHICYNILCGQQTYLDFLIWFLIHSSQSSDFPSLSKLSCAQTLHSAPVRFLCHETIIHRKEACTKKRKTLANNGHGFVAPLMCFGMQIIVHTWKTRLFLVGPCYGPLWNYG